MERFIDLHTHSTVSDGSMSPAELVIHAKEMGLSAIALTDHDTIDGIEEALIQAEKSGVEVIPGVEISVDYYPEMHIIGYFNKDTYKNVNNILEIMKENRNKRNPKIVNKLNEMGMVLTMRDVEDEAKGNVVGRPHIAETLYKKGYVKSLNEAFEKYLSEGKPAYFRRSKISAKEGIREILKADGVPVLAHPRFLHKSINELDGLFKELKTYGLEGVEAYYSENTSDETGNLLRLAMKHEFIVTGGSDFHGTYKEGIELGKGRGNLKVPYELLDKLKQLTEKRNQK